MRPRTTWSLIAGAMLRGRWLARSDLDAMLGGLKASFRPALLERIWPLALLALAVLVALKARS